MDHIETLLHSASYFGVIEKMMAMSTTDIAVLFLLSKPAFILTAGLVVLTTRHESKEATLTDEERVDALAER